MNCILINILREFGMYAIKKDIKKQSFKLSDKLLTFLFKRKRIHIVLIGEIKLEIDKEIRKLVEIHNIDNFESIKNLEIPNNTFVWVLDKNTTIHSKEFLNALMKVNNKFDFIYFDEEFSLNDEVFPFLKPTWSPLYFSYNNIGNALWINSSFLGNLKDKTLDELKHNISKLSNNVLSISEIISKSKVTSIEIDNSYNINDSEFNQDELVSIIILTKDKAEYLKRLIDSIEKKTSYKNYEILIVDHESKENNTIMLLNSYSTKPNFKIIKYNSEFNFSKMNNLAVKEAKGTYLVFLNNDIEIIENNWIERMLYYSEQNNIGIVGAKLLYPDETVQHGGIAVGIYSTTGHFQRGISKSDPGYMNTCKYPREILAVTGACMMISKVKFNLIGKFNEDFKVIFNDVDLSLKSFEYGLTNIIIGNLSFIHYEGITRGINTSTSEKDKDSIKLFWNKWGKFVKNDPYFNIHFNRESEKLTII